jgi:hypothetical protein
MWDLPRHTYEEIREVVVDILLKRETVTYEPDQWGHLTTGVAEVFARRATGISSATRHERPRIHAYDAELVRDVFWDLFRQGLITLGLNDSNPQWPFFRLSHFGKKSLDSQSPYRFHDTGTFINLVRTNVPDVSSEAITYLEEAVAAFYAECLLASCVMLGVASEIEFLRLVDVVSQSAKFGGAFASIDKLPFVRQKITKFNSLIKPLFPQLPRNAVEDFETNLSMIQSVLRVARNEAGHATGASVGREQVYVFLQLFIPFARQLMRLRLAMNEA